jgi:hypothetical protein
MKITGVVLLSLFSIQCGFTSNQAMTNRSGNANSQAARSEVNGQTVRWEEQGITFTVPRDWRKDDSVSQQAGIENESLISGLVWKSPRNQRIDLTIDTGETDFPVPPEEMLEADYEHDKSNAQVKDLRYEELGGVKGLYYRTPTGDETEINASWLTYRHYKGKAQLIGVRLMGPQRETELLMTILKSLKLDHD